MQKFRRFFRIAQILWEDLRAFRPPAAFLVIGLFCCGFIQDFGSVYVAVLMAILTLLVYFFGRRLGGWGQLMIGIAFSLCVVGAITASIFIGYFFYSDFSPNGRENYAEIRRDFFPREIPSTAYDVTVWSRVSFGRGWDESYLSFGDTKENIRNYELQGRERSELRTRHPYINDTIRVPRIVVDESKVLPRFAALPIWQRIFFDYTPHPAKWEELTGKYAFYVWNNSDDFDRPRADIIGISEDGTHVIFYAVGR